MKKKDMIYIGIIAAIFLIVGMYMYTKYGPGKKQDTAVMVEVIDPIPSSFNEQAISMLRDTNQTVDYMPEIDLNNLGNPRPFGPLR